MRPRTVIRWLCFAGLIAFTIVMALTNTGFDPAVMLGGYFAICSVALALMWWLDRRRIRALRNRLESLGFADAPAQFLYPPAKHHHSYKEVFFMAASFRGSRVLAGELKYATGHGKHRRSHRLFQLTIQSDHALPAFDLCPLPEFEHRPISRLFIRPPTSSNLAAQLADRFDVFGITFDQLVSLPGNEIARFLSTSPKGQFWSIRDGQLCGMWRGDVNTADLDSFLSRIGEFASLTARR